MDLIQMKNRRLLNDAVSKARIEKMQEKEALESDKIGNAKFVVGEKFTKGGPRANRDTLYIYAESLQASNEVFGEKIGDTIEVDNGVKLNVTATSALVRTDANGDLNPNVVGLVTKLNAQKKNGVFIMEEGFFKDTDEHFNIFVEANERAINKIKELIFGENSPYTKISIVDSLATDKASLPKRFAEKLAEMLEEELGIFTQIVPSKGGFGLKIMKLGKSKRKAQQTKLNKAKSRAKDILKSLTRERPKLDSVMVDPKDRSLLSQMFPNIEKRIARVSFITEAFSRKLTDEINRIRETFEKIEERSEEEEFYYRGLTNGLEENQRLFALKYFTIGGVPLGVVLLNDIRNYLADYVKAASSEGGIDNIARQLLTGEGEAGELFLLETDGKFEPGSARLKQIAYARARYLAEEYAKMIQPGVFDALCRDAAVELEFLENIRFTFEGNPAETEDDENEDNDEGEKENANKEGYMVKYKLMDPAKSLSTRIKVLLGSLYKRDYRDSSRYVFDDLGNLVKMDPLVAYRVLLEEFSEMRSPDAFVSTLDTAIEKYPWLAGLRSSIVFDPLHPEDFDEDLRNEFFSVMRRAKVPYGMVTQRGLLKRLNRNSSAADILDNVRSRYEGRILKGSHPIYTETGDANVENCKAIHRLFTSAWNSEKIVGSGKEASEKKKWASYKYQPFEWALKKLKAFQSNTNRTSKYGPVNDVKTALKILAGLSDDHKGINLEDTLQSIGIDTDKLNIDNLFGDIPFLDEDALDEISTLDDLEEHISNDQVSRLITVLTNIENIVSQTRQDRYQSGDHLVTKFQGYYINLGGALALDSDGYTAMTFRHNGAMRSSYAAPDFISDLVGIISNTDNAEDATEWIEQNYGQYDFYKDPITGEWYNSWLEDFMTVEDGEYIFRSQFDYINVLSFMGSEDSNSVGQIKEDLLKEGLVHAFFAGNRVGGNSSAYYGSPLLSDVDACVLLKGRRFTGEGYKEEIIKRLAKVLLQEANRIKEVLVSKDNPETTKIEFYNSGRTNGTKFQYFPSLNSRRDEILEAVTIKPGETPIEFKNRRDKKLQEIVREVVEAKAARFLKSWSESEKLNFHRKREANAKRENNPEEQDTEKIILEKEEEDPIEKEELVKRRLQEADELLTEFYYNNYLAHSQIQHLLGGDLAFYKNYVDYIKRNKQAYACGDRLFARETDDQGNIIGDYVESVIYLEDEDVISNSYESLKNLLMSSDMSDADKAIIRFTLESYKNITSTDGQSFRTIDSFRKIFKAKGGTWTDEMERAYQNIKKGTITGKDFLSLWNPIKPFYYGHESIEIDGRIEKVPTQHKNSEYMITAFFSFLNTALNKSPKLVGLHKFMIDHNIDVVHFHSVVKEGFNSPFDLRYNKAKFDKMSKEGEVTLFGKPFEGTYKDYMNELIDALEKGSISQEEFTEARNVFEYQSADEVVKALEAQSVKKNGEINQIMFKQFPMDSYMIVQPSKDHLIDQEALLGSQLKNIIMADLPDNFSMTINLNGKEETLDREG